MDVASKLASRVTGSAGNCETNVKDLIMRASSLLLTGSQCVKTDKNASTQKMDAQRSHSSATREGIHHSLDNHGLEKLKPNAGNKERCRDAASKACSAYIELEEAMKFLKSEIDNSSS